MGRSIRIQELSAPETEQMPDPLVEPEALGETIGWKELFGRSAPVEVEIGFGKGRYLIHAAQARPEADFLGREWALPFVRLVRYRIYRRRIRNVKLVRADALDILGQRIPAGSVRAMHVLFPDPWPKKRHHKRRLVSPGFAQMVVRVLEPGGAINVATDHAGYAEVIEPTLDAAQGLERLPGFGLDGDLAELTNYGTKYAREGRSFHAWSYRKTRG